MKHELAQPVKQGEGGAIVNLSSVSGIRGYPELAAYSAAKHGVVGLTRGAATEYGAHNIRVNALAPGWVETPMTSGYGSDPAIHQAMVDDAPLRRTAQPEEIADTIVYLCSDAASFITGDIIAIDSGPSIWPLPSAPQSAIWKEPYDHLHHPRRRLHRQHRAPHRRRSPRTGIPGPGYGPRRRPCGPDPSG